MKSSPRTINDVPEHMLVHGDWLKQFAPQGAVPKAPMVKVPYLQAKIQ